MRYVPNSLVVMFLVVGEMVLSALCFYGDVRQEMLAI